MYGYPCEYCEGAVQPRTVEREAFKHKDGFIILEDVTIGVCDSCGNRYYSADVLRTVHELARRPRARRNGTVIRRDGYRVKDRATGSNLKVEPKN
jgi:YgiT-type zinc finger domain-containing protein